MTTIEEIRNQVPALFTKVYNKPLVYFDNAATSQRPISVIEKLNEMSVNSNSNIHRAVHYLSSVATDEYESTRKAVAKYINAPSTSNIVFTSGATASINLVSNSFCEKFLKSGDEIIVSQAEHHSNIVSWQIAVKRIDANIKVLPVDDNGILRIDLLPELITSRTRLLAITHISNVLGIINPIKEICSICHSYGVPVLIDGAQGIVHCDVDVQNIDCDFYVFSGHKIYASTGTGVLYAKTEWLEEMPPFMGGGEMISHVSFKETSFAAYPMKFEAGTQNFNSIPTLKPALEFCKQMREIEDDRIKKFLLDYLTSDNRIKLFGVPRGTNQKISLFSFIVKNVHHEDLALLLDKMGIATRSGQMCAEPLMDRFSVTGMLRISLAPYNTMEEAEYFIKSLNKAIEMLI